MFLVWGLGLVSQASYAQEDEGIDEEFALLEEELAADEVESASKHRQSIFWSPSTITVITREDIYASGANNLGDLLRRVPGFDVYLLKQEYPVVGSRALTSADSNNLLLLLVDGREAAIELTGFPLWNALAIDLEEIERIEIVRGPGSTLYGANAYAGVVSITTMAERTEPGGDLMFSEGEEGHYYTFGRIRGGHSFGRGVLSYSAGAGFAGKRVHSDLEDQSYELHRAHAYLRYRLGKQLDVSLHAGTIGGDGLVFVHMGDIRIIGARNYSLMGKADIGLSDSVRLKTQLYYSRYDCDLHYRSEFRAYNLWIADIPEIWWNAQAIDGQVQVNWQLADDLLVIGGGYVHYSFLEHRNLVLKDDDELRGAGFVQAQWSPFEALQLTGGVRADLNTDTETAVSPRVVAVLRPWPEHAFRLSYGLAFRKPSFYENRFHLRITSYAFPEVVDKLEDELGNEDLGNEQVHSFEVGWLARFLNERLRVSVDLFFNVYQDPIDFVIDLPLRMGLPDIQGSTLRFEQTDTEVYALGGETELAWHLDQRWSLWCNLGLRRVTDGESGRRLVTEPVLRVNLGLRYLPPAGPVADLALHYVSSYQMPLIDPANTLNPPEFQSLGQEVLLIARLGYRFQILGERTVETGLTVRAPLGAPFREVAGIPRPSELRFDTNADFGGEQLVRLVALYLRGSF